MAEHRSDPSDACTSKPLGMMRKLIAFSSKLRRSIPRLSPTCFANTTPHGRPMQGCSRRRIRMWSASFRGLGLDRSRPAAEPMSKFGRTWLGESRQVKGRGTGSRQT
jgi:hypothetical protein